MKRSILFMLALVCAISTQVVAAGTPPVELSSKPNIVLLFSDDAGYGDFGFHGSVHFKTPHLDQLAASGVKLSQFYVTGATCGPSRAGLLSGRYQQRLGFEEINVPGIMSENSKLLGDEMGLPTDFSTMGNYLQELGYRTAVFGKWHMGVADRYHPLKRGFDEFYGFRGGARSFFAYSNPKKAKHENLIERNFGNYKEHEGYLTDALANETCAFIERSKDVPFFTYVSFNAVHTPMEPDPKDKGEFPQLEGKRRQVAQMTLSMDRACGQIINKLKELGLYENTIIVFSNDNGGPMDKNGSSNYPFAGVKGTQLEGGIRVPGLISWTGRLPAGAVYDKPMTTLDLIPTFVKAGGGNSDVLEGLDGVDMVPYLTGANKGRPHQTLHWKMETRGTIIDGDWKLLRFPDRPAELFNLAEDPGEQNNLATEKPELVKALFKKQFAWELELQRPLFMLRRQEEGWSARRADEFRVPPSASY
ncbi:sulfatase-like hydrolase/transferase [Pontiella sulfatireligans]|uniref:Arylsulfatase n=1 Tax=Pontiella sulfatireligans TaxID=2750658 RepID=A0A6C2UP51_9BACT|nr:sulfatase-like hydrolase/transferase [Pontiella sulfatireligans]SPS74464.1 sulfatase S1_19 [Kiritimatiellales bacterium]VGO21723.1 Arylsulfatase [Pontiella sulfatireligans]